MKKQKNPFVLKTSTNKLRGAGKDIKPMIKSLFVITLLSMGLLATINEIRVKVEYGHFLWIAKKAIFSLDQKDEGSAEFQEIKKAGSVSKWYMWANYFGKLSKTESKDPAKEPAKAPVYDVSYNIKVDDKQLDTKPAGLLTSEKGKPIYYQSIPVVGLCPNNAVKEIKLDNVKFDGTKTFLVAIKVICTPATEAGAKPAEAKKADPSKKEEPKKADPSKKEEPVPKPEEIPNPNNENVEEKNENKVNPDAPVENKVNPDAPVENNVNPDAPVENKENQNAQAENNVNPDAPVENKVNPDAPVENKENQNAQAENIINPDVPVENKDVPQENKDNVNAQEGRIIL